MSAETETRKEDDELEVRHRAELDSQREEFHRELGRRAFRIGELEEKVEEMIRTYETSLSWRLTAPVRGVGALLRKLRG